MLDDEEFDTNFDFRAELPRGEKDTDQWSQMLRKYHRRLWRKPLPNDELFDLELVGGKHYLRLRSSQGEFQLTSDSTAQTWTSWGRMREITADTSEAEFLRVAHQIGGKVLFPTRKLGDAGEALPPTRE